MQRALLFPEQVLLLFFLQANHLKLLNDNILLYLFVVSRLSIIDCIRLQLNIVLQLLNFHIDVPYLLYYLALVEAVIECSIPFFVNCCKSIYESEFDKAACTTLVFFLLLLLILMHLLFEDSFIKVLEQDSDEQVQ
jgi:hypothetical protein